MIIDIRNISSRFFKEEIPSDRLDFLVFFHIEKWRQRMGPDFFLGEC